MRVNDADPDADPPNDADLPSMSPAVSDADPSAKPVDSALCSIDPMAEGGQVVRPEKRKAPLLSINKIVEFVDAA